MRMKNIFVNLKNAIFKIQEKVGKCVAQKICKIRLRMN